MIDHNYPDFGVQGWNLG